MKIILTIITLFNLTSFRTINVTWLLVITCIGVISCTPRNQEQQIPPPSQTLRITIGASPHTLDPQRVAGLPGYKVLAALCEPLLTMDYTTFEIEPGVAERWEQSQDGLTYQFYIREQAQWSNGDRLVAYDFVSAFQRIFSPKLGNQYATEYFAIKNSEAFYSGKLSDFTQVGVHALSDTILQISLEHLDPLFLKRLTNLTAAPVHRQGISQFGALDDPLNPWADRETFIGNGPFSLVDWQLNKKIVVVKNPYYWDSATIHLQAIEYNLADSEAAEERLFRTGKVDLVYGGRVPAERAAHYREDNPQELVSQLMYGTYYYFFNTQKKPFDNPKVRRALSLSIDRRLLIDATLKNGEKSALALSVGTQQYSPPQQPDYNPEMARRLLAEAGFPNGKGFREFSILFNSLDSHRKIAVVIQQMWAKELNLQVKLESQEWKVFLDSRQSLDYDVARSGSYSLIGDPADLIGSLVTGHGMNDAGWSNVNFDNLLLKAEQEVDEQKRLKFIYEAEKIMLAESPIIPLFYYKNSYLISPRVRGFEFNMLGLPNYRGVYLDKSTSGH